MHDTALYVVWLNIDIEMPKILLVSRGVCRFNTCTVCTYNRETIVALN